MYGDNWSVNDKHSHLENISDPSKMQLRIEPENTKVLFGSPLVCLFALSGNEAFPHRLDVMSIFRSH